MKINDYYEKMAKEANDISMKKLLEKEKELETIFSKIRISDKKAIKLAVLGCGDFRHLEGNSKIFSSVLGKNVTTLTYDLDIKHLNNNAVKHDCTTPLPEKGFDITYGHVLLKFIPESKQLDLILNSVEALSEKGIAIHIFDNEDLEISKEENIYQVKLDIIENYLSINEYTYKLIPLKYGQALIIFK